MWDENGCYFEYENGTLPNISDEEAVEVAFSNLAAQADDTYFDGTITYEINGKSFYDDSFSTSALLMTWEGLIRFKENEENGLAHIEFLDLATDFLIVFREEGYQLKTFHSEYEVDENNIVLSSETSDVLSEIIPKKLFEQEIERACGAFIEFCEKNNLPVNANELDSLKNAYHRLIGEKGGIM